MPTARHTLTHTHISLPVAAKNQKKSQKKKTVEILLSDYGLSTVLQAHVVAVDAAFAAADQVGRPPADHSSTGVQKAAKERGGRGVLEQKRYSAAKQVSSLKYFSPLASLSLYMALNFAVRERDTHTHRNAHTHTDTDVHTGHTLATSHITYHIISRRK